MPYAFTEQGIAMLSALLNSDISKVQLAILTGHFVYCRYII